MLIGRDRLKSLTRNLSKETGVPPQEIMRAYAIERLAARLPADGSFVIKGGALIVSIVGIASRMTMDLDATVSGLGISDGAALAALREAASIDLGDGMEFFIGEPEEIMSDRKYAGVKAPVTAAVGKTKINFHVDLSTGDPITPHPVMAELYSVFSNRGVVVPFYPMETVIAEKLHALLSRGTGTTRQKDLYDLKVIHDRFVDEIDPETLAQAIEKTFSTRGSESLMDGWKESLETIASDPGQIRMWESYVKRSPFAEGIELGECIAAAAAFCEKATSPCRGKELGAGGRDSAAERFTLAARSSETKAAERGAGPKHDVSERGV